MLLGLQQHQVRNAMPVNRKMMKSMKDQYGDKKGEEVYYAMEMKHKKNKMNMGGMPKKNDYVGLGMNKGGMPTHKMPDGTVMKGAKHGYAHGGMACGASNPPARPIKKGK